MLDCFYCIRAMDKAACLLYLHYFDVLLAAPFSGLEVSCRYSFIRPHPARTKGILLSSSRLFTLRISPVPDSIRSPPSICQIQIPSASQDTLLCRVSAEDYGTLWTSDSDKWNHLVLGDKMQPARVKTANSRESCGDEPRGKQGAGITVILSTEETSSGALLGQGQLQILIEFVDLESYSFSMPILITSLVDYFLVD